MTEATAVAVDGSGNVFVTGSSLRSWHVTNYVRRSSIRARDVPLWTNRYNGPDWRIPTGPANGDDEATAVAVDSSGNVFVTGVRLAAALLITQRSSIRARACRCGRTVTRGRGPAGTSLGRGGGRQRQRVCDGNSWNGSTLLITRRLRIRARACHSGPTVTTGRERR